MKKNELVGLVSEKCGITKKDCIVELKPFNSFERTHFAEIL